MRLRVTSAISLGLIAATASAQQAGTDMAAAFGAREAMAAASLSPDGTKVAFQSPAAGQGSVLYVFDTTAPGGQPRQALRASGDPDRLYGCLWVSNDRLACQTGGYQEYNGEIFGFSSMVAVDAAGGNIKSLSKRRGDNALYADFRGGGVIDYLPGTDGEVMMIRSYVPEAKIGSMIEKTDEGMGVDRINTRTLAVKRVEGARRDAVEYITDGRGEVRIMGSSPPLASGYSSGKTVYAYRKQGERDWSRLSEYDYLSRTGFNPYAVDPAKNVAYGFEKIDGRQALVSYSLDGRMDRTVVVSHPVVDVDGLLQIGRQQRVVGASFATEKREAVYFDPELKRLAASLGKALPNQPLIEFADANADESKLLIWAGGDTSPGTYYLFDKASKKLQPIQPVRPNLQNTALAAVKPVMFPAGDGTKIPGYLTLPPGSTGKGLPAIVMPHGGPSARDEWGFDWLAQYYANRGFAVLQPNYRGSSGYGDGWYQQNGFVSWKTAIGDVNDAGRWLVSSGVADPAKLHIVGWSYGGYAALQSAVLDPALFKKIVAIAPVTDLEQLKSETRNFSSRRVNENFIGSGPHIKEGSPAQNASRIAAPVLMFHGELDRNVRIAQSRLMAKKLREAGKMVELIEYPKLEHSLVDSSVRADMLRKSADFLAK
jgi:acetyl esterase/lipase